MYKKIFVRAVIVLSLVSQTSLAMDIEAFDDFHPYCSLDQDSQLFLPFQSAVVSGNLNEMNNIARKVNVRDVRRENGNTWLHIATREQQIDSVNLLLEKGSDVFCMNNESKMPVDIASKLGNYAILLALSEKMKAIYHVNANNARSSINRMYPPSLCNFLENYDLRLAHAIIWQNISDVKRLVYELRSRVNAKMPYFEISPLMLAKYVNNQEIIDFLSENGATE